MGKIDYSGTTTGGSPDALCDANAARTSLFFNAVGSDFTLTFNHKGVDQTLTVKQGNSLTITNTHREPLDCRDAITVESAGAADFECFAEEG